MKPFTCSVGIVSRRRLSRAFGLVALFGITTLCAIAQDAAPRGDGERRRGGGGEEGGRRNFSPQDMQARMLTMLRERLGVTNDEEWTLISERIAKISEVRRTTGGATGGIGFRGPGGPGGPGGSGGRGDGQGGGEGGFRGRPGGGSPESQALRSAIEDKLPDAEVKARLVKLRETRKANEKKLEQAQEDLRAVLTVRQEAVMVLMGFLP